MYLALERYSRPTSIAECLRLLAEPDQSVALLAGGTDLNVSGHEKLTHVIDIQALPLDHIVTDGGALRLGARVTLARLRRHLALQLPRLTALRQAARAFANVAIQNRSTLGGRIMVDRSDQDVPVALAALGAQLRLTRLSGGEVAEQVIDLPVGQQARAQLDGALVTEVVIGLGSGNSAHRRFARTAVDVPLACCAAAEHDGSIRLAAGLQGPGAADLLRTAETEMLVSSWGAQRPVGWQQMARTSLLGELEAYGDAWASGAYRRDLTATMAVRALSALFGETAQDGEEPS